MQSLAWSTIILIVLLLPGFFFTLGQLAPAGFGRDLTPRNPLGALAGTVLIALASHFVLSSSLALVAQRLGWPSLRVEWSAVIEAVQMPPPPADATTDPLDLDTAAERTGAEVTHHGFAIAGYIFTSCGIGFLIGIVYGKLSQSVLPFLMEHSWAYRVNTGHKRNVTKISYAHVLADVGHAGQQLLYRGRLLYFALRNDGSFAYVVLLATEQRLLNLTGNAPSPGPRRSIGGRGATPPAEARANSWWRRRWRPEESGALMFIAGSNIKDLVFQGHYEVKDLDDASRMAEKIEEAERTGNVEEARRLRAELTKAPPEAEPQTPTPVLHPVREAQRLLSMGGLYDGPVDGIAGRLTREAILSFQRGHGLHADGVLGPVTLERLRKEYGS